MTDLTSVLNNKVVRGKLQQYANSRVNIGKNRLAQDIIKNTGAGNITGVSLRRYSQIALFVDDDHVEVRYVRDRTQGKMIGQCGQMSIEARGTQYTCQITRCKWEGNRLVNGSNARSQFLEHLEKDHGTIVAATYKEEYKVSIGKG